MKRHAEALWELFEQTGSITAYIFYRRTMPQ